MSDDAPAAVERWQLSGGTWRVASVSPERAAVDLLRCDGGEVVERLVLTGATDLRWAAMQFASEGEDQL